MGVWPVHADSRKKKKRGSMISTCGFQGHGGGGQGKGGFTVNKHQETTHASGVGVTNSGRNSKVLVKRKKWKGSGDHQCQRKKPPKKTKAHFKGE